MEVAQVELLASYRGKTLTVAVASLLLGATVNNNNEDTCTSYEVDGLVSSVGCVGNIRVPSALCACHMRSSEFHAYLPEAFNP